MVAIRLLSRTAIVVQQSSQGFGLLLSVLREGGRPDESELARALRSPSCPQRLVEEVATCRWVLRSARLLPLVIRHPACPRPFAWEAIPHLGWHDLLDVARYPRTAPPVRRQAERKLLDKVGQLTSGERVALARLAPRTVVPALLGLPEPPCVQALLDNPQFTEADALRLLASNSSPACLAAVVRHRKWGQSPAVIRSAARCAKLPLGLALGLLAVLPARELAALARAPEVNERLRRAASELIVHRERGVSE
jgi:hypothetical protein